MKNNFIARLRLGGMILLLIQLTAFSFYNQTAFAQESKTKLNIKDTPETIIVNTKLYNLLIEKSNALVHLQNWQGFPYTSFPLGVQFNLDDIINEYGLNQYWKIRGKTITMTTTQNNVRMQEIKLTCDDESFEIQLSTRVPNTVKTGAYLFRRDKNGFDTSNWDQYFSPEPDDYFKTNPSVDIRVDRDQQWTFTPAPLNLSFKTAAGWLSIGLADLPDASIYTFKDEALWLDFPWDKITKQKEGLFRFPPLFFTFNNSPWEAVSDFSNHLYTQDKDVTRPSHTEPRPDWWTRPLVSTWGEQRVQNITIANPQYTSKWVKNYVSQQQQALDSLKFTLIIENKWARADGDPYPSDRFHDLRSLIDWCHDQDIKVILHWKAWKVEANSIAIELVGFNGEYIDATHPGFESYVDSCCQILLEDGPEELNADGLKIDYLFLVRDPVDAIYSNVSLGIGFRESHHYLETFYRIAKKYKSDALIMSSAIDPHFLRIQDMVKINDDWDNKLVREKRARIISQALPGMLINGEASDMSIKIASYHYVTSSVYGIPCIQYLTRLHDAEITQEFQNILLQILKLYNQKPDGKLKFVDYGHWQILDKNDEVLVETIPGGKGLLIYNNKSEALFLCTENSKVHLVLERHLLKIIHDENKETIPFTDLGHGIYELEKLEQGKIYQLRLRKISTKRR